MKVVQLGFGAAHVGCDEDLSGVVKAERQGIAMHRYLNGIAHRGVLHHRYRGAGYEPHVQKMSSQRPLSAYSYYDPGLAGLHVFYSHCDEPAHEK